MNTSSLFVENLRTSSIVSMNDIRTTQFSLNSLGSYIYSVLNSSSITNCAYVNSSNMFQILPQSNQTPVNVNDLTTKIYVDDTIQSISNGLYNQLFNSSHSWSNQNTFSNLIINSEISVNASRMNLSPNKIGYTYVSEFSSDISLSSIPKQINLIELPSIGVWNIQGIFEWSGEGIITHLDCGYSIDQSLNYLNQWKLEEDVTYMLENDKLQRMFNTMIAFDNVINSSNQVFMISSVTANGTIFGKSRYLITRIA